MKSRKLLALLAILFSFGLIVAACGDSDDDGDGDTDEADSGSVSDSDADDEGDEADAMEGDEGDEADAMEGDEGDEEADAMEGDEGDDDAAAPTVDGQALKLGYILPQTGDLSSIVEALVGGIELAVEEINEAGGNIELVPADSGTNPDTASSNVDGLLNDDVDAILGAAASGVSGAIVDKVTGSGTLQCSGSNTAAALSTIDDNGLYFRTAPSDILQGPALADVVAESDATNIAIVYRNDDYGSGFNDSLSQAIEDNGLTIAESIGYDPEATSFDAEAGQITASGADGVVIITFAEGAKLLQSMIEEGVGPDDVPVFVADGFKDTVSAEDVDPENADVLEGIRGTAPSASPENGEATFPDRFAEFAPDTPTIFSAQFYDCVQIIALAAEVAGSSDPAEMAAAIQDVTAGGEKCTSYADCASAAAEGTDIDYDGASGPLEFDDVGEPGVGTYDVFTYDAEGEAQTDSQAVIE